MALLGLASADPVDDEVVVAAPDRDLGDTVPTAVTTIPVDERLPEGADVAGVVATASGATVSRLGGLGDYASVSLRGSSARQVEVQLDGVPLNPDGVGAVDLSELPLRAFRAVEIWRGASPGGLGGGPMGGVVNLVTADGDVGEGAGSAGTLSTTRLRAAFGRAGARGDALVAGQGLSTLGDFRWLDDAGTRTRTDDDRWRVRENNDTRTASLHARIRQRAGDWTLTALGSGVAREEGVPGFTSRPTAGVRYGATQGLAVLQADRTGAAPLLARAHVRRRDEVLSDPLGELGAFGGDARSRADGGGVDLRAGAVTGRARVDGQVGVRVDRFGAPDALRTRGVAHGRAGVTWAPVPAFVGTAGLGGVTLITGEARTDAVLPRAGVLVRAADGWTLKANAGRAFRPPDPTELFGNRGVLVGRADLRPERGTSADVGVRRTSRWGSAELGGFWTRAVDRIVYVQNAQQVAVATNLGSSTVIGAEGALTVSGVPWLDLQTNATLQRSRNHSDIPLHDGRPLPRQPWLQLDQRTAFVGGAWRVGHTFAFTSAMSTDEAGLARQAPRPIHGLFARFTGRDGLGLELDVLNALDTHVLQTPANPLDPRGPRAPTAITDFVGYPLPGRTILLTVRYEGP